MCHSDSRTQSLPADHCTETKWLLLFTIVVSSFNVADWCVCQYCGCICALTVYLTVNTWRSELLVWCCIFHFVVEVIQSFPMHPHPINRPIKASSRKLSRSGVKYITVSVSFHQGVSLLLAFTFLVWTCAHGHVPVITRVRHIHVQIFQFWQARASYLIWVSQYRI